MYLCKILVKLDIVRTVDKIWDPLRKKEVALTPEEQVRQWFISILLTDFKVPPVLARSEVAFDFGQEVGGLDGFARKRYRADIVVYDREHRPLVAVECKRPDVKLDSSVAEQSMRYNSVLGVRWIVLTNGVNTMVFKRGEGNVFKLTATLPTYDELTT